MRIGAFTFHHGCHAATGWQKESMTLSVAVMTSTACMLVGLHTGTVYIYIHMAYVDISYDAYVMYEIMKHIVIYSYSFPPMSCLMGPLYEKQAVG